MIERRFNDLIDGPKCSSRLRQIVGSWILRAGRFAHLPSRFVTQSDECVDTRRNRRSLSHRTINDHDDTTVRDSAPRYLARRIARTCLASHSREALPSESASSRKRREKNIAVINNLSKAPIETQFSGAMIRASACRRSNERQLDRGL